MRFELWRFQKIKFIWNYRKIKFQVYLFVSEVFFIKVLFILINRDSRIDISTPDL